MCGAVKHVLLHTLDKRIPFVGLSEQYVRAGALLALAASYEDNGRQAAELVKRVLAGESAAAIAIATPSQIEVVFNPKTAELEMIETGTLPVSFTSRPRRNPLNSNSSYSPIKSVRGTTISGDTAATRLSICSLSSAIASNDVSVNSAANTARATDNTAVQQ